MKRHFTLLLAGILACLSLTSSLAQPCTGNLLSNPGFESGLTGWNTTGTVTVSASANTGSKAAKVGGTGYASVGFILPATTGTAYTAKVYAKYTGSSFRVVELRFLNTSYTTLPGAAQAQPATTTYTEYTLNGTAPAGAAYVYVIASKDGSGSIEVDDWCLTTATSSGLPDYVPVVQTGIVAAANTQPLTFTVAIKNQGTVAGNTGYLQAYLSSDNQFSPDDQSISYASNFLPAELQPGQTTNSVSVTYTVPANNIFSGTKYILVFVDYLNYSLESDEVNNIFAFPVQISTTPVPTGCVHNLGAGEILCTEKSGSNLLVYLMNNQVVTKYTLNGQGMVVSSQNMGLWVQDSVLVQGNQVKKKLVNGTIAYTKTIPQSVLDSLPVVQAATELTDGTFVLAGYKKPDNTNPISASKNYLVMVHTNANLAPIQVKSKLLSAMSNPYFNFGDQVLLLRPAPNAAFDIFYTGTTETLYTFRYVQLSRFSFANPQSFDQVPSNVTNLVSLGTTTPIKLTQTPCGSYRFSGPTGSLGQKGSFFGQILSYFDIQDLSLISSQVDGSGNADYYGSYDRWSFVSLLPDPLTGSFQYRPGFDPVPAMQFLISNPGQPSLGVNVPYFNYDHAVLMQPNDVFLFGTNNGQVFVEVPTDCYPVVVLQPDLTGEGLNLPPNPVFATGESVSFNFTLKNIGNFGTDPSLGVAMTYYISTDATLSANDLQVSDFSASYLTAGATTNIDGYFSLPTNIPSGSYYVLVKIDPNNEHLESNENNNLVVSAQTFTVSGGGSCSIDGSVSTQCSDNGTPGNPNDDTYTVTLLVTGTNTGNQGWKTNSVGVDFFGSYGQPATFGPYSIVSGNGVFNIQDVVNPACTDQVYFLPPAPCSNGGPGNQIDLSLSLQQLTTTPAQWSNYAVKATISNAGPQAATGVKVKFAKPTGVVYVGGNEFTASQGNFNPNGDEVWTVGSIPANGSATLTVNYFLLNATAPVAYAQVTAANETDSDSQPNNGTPPTPVQDDEASTAGGNNNVCPGNLLVNGGFENILVGWQNTNVVSNDPAGAHSGSSYASLCADASNSSLNIISQSIPLQGGTSYSLTAFAKKENNTATGFMRVKYYSANNTQLGSSADAVVNNTATWQQLTLTLNPPAGTTQALLEFPIGPPSSSLCFFLDDVCLVPSTSTTQPDLTISDLQIPTASVAAGAILSYNFDASNAGTAAVPGNFTIKSYISTDQTLSANDVQDGNINTGNYGVGFAVQNVPGASTIPASLGAGSYFLIVKIDGDNAIAEGNENNNVVVKPFTVTAGPVVCHGDLILTTQAEVNAVPNCSIVDGLLWVRSPNGSQGASSDITDLSPLLGIKQVNGFITIENNDQLFNLHGLENIKSADGVAVVFCENLNQVHAFSGLTGEMKSINILSNPSLLSVDGFEGITSLSIGINLTTNTSLQNLNGFSNITHISKEVHIGGNTSLTSMHGLNKLTSIGEGFIIENCDALQTLNGLQHLQSVGYLALLSNDALQDVSALGALSTVQNSLFVKEHPLLSDCCVFYNLLNNNGVGGSVTFGDNAGNCNAAQDILNSCSGSSDPCAAISITTGPNKITIAGAVAPHVLIKVFRPNWTVAYECLDGACANPTVVTGLGAGSHFVEIKLLNASWGEICKKTLTVGVSNLIAPTEDRMRLNLDRIYPSPAKYMVTMDVFSPKDQAATLDFYDQQGRHVHSFEVFLEEGQNAIEQFVFDWKSGTYNVIARGEETALPAYGRFLKVWEE